MLQCVAVCYSVVQCVAVCCSVVQCGAACCSVLQCGAACCRVSQCVAVSSGVLFGGAPGASTHTEKLTKHISQFTHLPFILDGPLFLTAKKTDSTDTFLSLSPSPPALPCSFSALGV